MHPTIGTLLALVAVVWFAAGVPTAADRQARAALAEQAPPGVHTGVYHQAAQRWQPGDPVQLVDEILFDNTTFTGGYLPLDQVAGTTPPARLLDWGTSPGASPSSGHGTAVPLQGAGRGSCPRVPFPPPFPNRGVSSPVPPSVLSVPSA